MERGAVIEAVFGEFDDMHDAAWGELGHEFDEDGPTRDRGGDLNLKDRVTRIAGPFEGSVVLCDSVWTRGLDSLDRGMVLLEPSVSIAADQTADAA